MKNFIIFGASKGFRDDYDFEKMIRTKLQKLFM